MMIWILFSEFKNGENIFFKTASILDDKRLGKQRQETSIIINTLKGKYKKLSWSNHPITRSCKQMLFNNDDYNKYALRAVKYYMNCMIKEFIHRGFKNNYKMWKIKCNRCSKFKNIKFPNKFIYTKCSFCCNKFKLYLPWWMYWKPYIQSNFASLLRKNPFHYKKYTKIVNFDDNYSNFGYIWPSKVLEINNYFNYSDPIMKENLNPIYCQQKILHGPSKGKYCNTLVRNKEYTPDSDKIYCGKHKKIKFQKKICCCILKSGNRVGEKCGIVFKSPYEFCQKHNRIK